MNTLGLIGEVGRRRGGPGGRVNAIYESRVRRIRYAVHRWKVTLRVEPATGVVDADMDPLDSWGPVRPPRVRAPPGATARAASEEAAEADP